MCEFLNKEKYYNAHDDGEVLVELTMSVIVRMYVIMPMSVVMMMMFMSVIMVSVAVVVSKTIHFRHRVEEDIAEKAANRKGYPVLDKLVFGILISCKG